MATTATLASALLSRADHATAATYTRGATTTTVSGIFEKAYVETFNTQGSQPMFMCATADVSSAVHGDTLVIGGTTYSVVGVEPDGTGVTTLRLAL